MKNRFAIISAFTKGNRGIGFENRLPWKIKEDMDWFKKITTQRYEQYPDGNSVIMGRKTWDSLPKKFKPLPDRYNFILTRSILDTSKNDPSVNVFAEQDDPEHNNTTYINQFGFVTHNCFVSTHNLKLKHFVIGGQQLYEQAIDRPECDELYLTEIDESVYNGGKAIQCDAFFPQIPRHFKKVEEIPGKTPGVTFQIWKNWRYFESPEYQYIEMLKRIINEGELTEGRNGNVLSVFGDFQHKFDLREGFPLLTTKRMPFDVIIKELLFFIRGDTDAKILSEDGVKIWDDNTTREFLDKRGLRGYPVGDMGPMYGWNWRHFGAQYQGCDIGHSGQGFDQLSQLLSNIMNEPNSRRLLLTTYDPSKVHESVLAPCHGLVVQFNVSGGEYLDCKMYQRSVDTALGYPFNIASYAAFTHIIAHVTNLKPRYLFTTLGDTHIYENHVEKVQRHFDRHPLKFPSFEITREFEGGDNVTVKDRLKYLESLSSSDFELKDYLYYPGIKMDMVA
jgi:dihydrofolate reductase/thymidylate synthase